MALLDPNLPDGSAKPLRHCQGSRPVAAETNGNHNQLWGPNGQLLGQQWVR